MADSLTTELQKIQFVIQFVKKLLIEERFVNLHSVFFFFVALGGKQLGM